MKIIFNMVNNLLYFLGSSIWQCLEVFMPIKKVLINKKCGSHRCECNVKFYESYIAIICSKQVSSHRNFLVDCLLQLVIQLPEISNNSVAIILMLSSSAENV